MLGDLADLPSKKSPPQGEKKEKRKNEAVLYNLLSEIR